ncbi:hypothetical protein [Mycobacterium sp. E802]|uniref:hypothetical protein n=1 Tax=Mycobacterium sp. E802 TaxID=1834152 RepID=UPI000AC72E69|nr:hypothetical protein [Mycobacterium sp. E802]
MIDDAAPLGQPPDADWDDPQRFEGVVAFSFVLPYLLPLEPQAVPIGVDDYYLRVRGVTPAEFDDAWTQMPFSCLTMWSVESGGVDPVVEDTTLASAALARVTGQEPQPSPQHDDGRQRSAVVVLIPVKSRTAALMPPHDGKVDPLTLAHWLIADAVRSLRIASMAPIPDLHYRSLNPIVPAAFGSVGEGGLVNFDQKQTAILLDHLPARLTTVPPVDQAEVGRVFGELGGHELTADWVLTVPEPMNFRIDQDAGSSRAVFWRPGLTAMFAPWGNPRGDTPPPSACSRFGVMSRRMDSTTPSGRKTVRTTSLTASPKGPATRGCLRSTASW